MDRTTPQLTQSAAPVGPGGRLTAFSRACVRPFKITPHSRADDSAIAYPMPAVEPLMSASFPFSSDRIQTKQRP